ncbi:MAG: N-acetylmuramic acid 6-phosphate etherase [Chloroflexi bacterium]|nr:N-acetylmuramic acid 6-phosphate etherase [Chloroflexota bacterium]
MRLENLSAMEIIQLMHSADIEAVSSVGRALDKIAAIVREIELCLTEGGRLFYVGAGTSGRLGVLDAAECPPTFGTPPEMVQGVIAGGEGAMFRAQEYSEDDPGAAKEDLKKRNLSSLDAVVGITASGTTPYVRGALEYAAEIDAYPALITCSPASPFIPLVRDAVIIEVGHEVLEGSTRLKAGTATKLVLNMISTAVMTGLGRVIGGRMASVGTGSAKLKNRAAGIIRDICNVSEAEAERLLETSGGNTAVALVMGTARLDRIKAEELLKSYGGNVRKVLELFHR